jgi:hypothetical protein
MFPDRPHRAKISVAPLVSAHSPRNHRFHLESPESLAMGASLSRDGHRLLSKRNAVRSNPLLRRCTIVSSCRCFRGFVRTGHRCAAPRSVPPRRIRRVLPRVLCRDSVRQVSKPHLITVCGRVSFHGRRCRGFLPGRRRTQRLRQIPLTLNGRRIDFASKGGTKSG